MNLGDLEAAFREGQRRAKLREEEDDEERPVTNARSSECCGARVLSSDGGVVCVQCGKVQD